MRIESVHVLSRILSFNYTVVYNFAAELFSLGNIPKSFW
ncbi:hypothetical protein LEP1GSC070_2514 [Leptospira santarosai str. AIM]|nr:hypothetical protein LEP1GSC070_2514 [Leptospira santarosai str. AIM]